MHLPAIGLALALIVSACGTAHPDQVPVAAAPTTEAGPSEPGDTAPTPPLSREPDPASEQPADAALPSGIVPARIEIPAIGVDATVTELDIRGSEPEVPDDFDQVGWYGLTRRPGEIGPAVLAGHVDSRQGPAVFFRLDELVTGDQIIVHSSDSSESSDSSDAGGEARTFEVVDAGQYPKVALPDEVFGFGEGVPELRLITCGGTFDRQTRHYADNVVVFAAAH
jgi:hypothetical protein